MFSAGDSKVVAGRFWGHADVLALKERYTADPQDSQVRRELLRVALTNDQFFQVPADRVDILDLWLTSRNAFHFIGFQQYVSDVPVMTKPAGPQLPSSPVMVLGVLAIHLGLQYYARSRETVFTNPVLPDPRKIPGQPIIIEPEEIFADPNVHRVTLRAEDSDATSPEREAVVGEDSAPPAKKAYRIAQEGKPVSQRDVDWLVNMSRKAQRLGKDTTPFWSALTFIAISKNFGGDASVGISAKERIIALRGEAEEALSVLVEARMVDDWALLENAVTNNFVIEIMLIIRRIVDNTQTFDEAERLLRHPSATVRLASFSAFDASDPIKDDILQWAWSLQRDLTFAILDSPDTGKDAAAAALLLGLYAKKGVPEAQEKLAEFTTTSDKKKQ